MKTITLIFLILVVIGVAGSQTYTEMGMMSGSGLIMTPTNIISPEAQFRIQLGRIGRTDDIGRGINLMTIGMGLSRIVEAYARFTGEQAGFVNSFTTIGYGVKVRVPGQLPILNFVSLWGETITSDMDDRGVLFSPRTSRVAILNTPVWSDIFRPTLIVGGVRYDGEKARLMVGANLVVIPSNSVQIGLEYIDGYTGRGGHHVMFSGMFRVIDNVGIQAGPGYVSSHGVTGWLWSIGISAGTADLDFHPKPVVRKEEYVLPTIDEILNPKGNETVPPDESDNQDQKENDQ